MWLFCIQNVCYSPKILSLDLTDKDSLVSKVQEAVGHYGRIDILVNNAGVSSRSTVMETQDSVIRRIMEVNFFGTVGLTKGTCTITSCFSIVGIPIISCILLSCCFPLVFLGVFKFVVNI